jgi:pyruvate, water dikinase
MDKANMYILWFDQLNNDDVAYVGGKNASLGEMYSALTSKGIRIPNGFAVTAHAYRYFLEKAGIKNHIKQILKDLDTTDMKNLSERGLKVRETILKAEFPEDLKKAILNAYKDLCGAYNKDRSDVDVAVRSSATAEDLPDASFAGQQETYLNISGDHQILESVKKCIASLFTNRAISYRVDKGFDHFSIALSVGVQRMVRSDMACSGVMFSIDTESGFKDAVIINGSWGLGENIVQGAVNPDEYYVFKPTLKQGFKPIISQRLGSKEIKMIYTHEGAKSTTRNVNVAPADRNRFCLTNDEVLTLARWACAIEDHYSWKAGKFKPMDMEWAKDGHTGELFIVQARPETVQSQKNKNVLETYVLKNKGTLITRGKSVGSKIGVGEANVIKNVHNIGDFKKGQVLVTDMTDPDWEPIMKIASAIVTNRGGRTCHAAIISRELGIPCVVGTSEATEKIKTGHQVTVSCAEGDEGYIYEGALEFEIQKVDLHSMPKTKTKIMMNVGNPQEVFELSFIPNDGVGLAREEFIVTSYIKAHPLALLHYKSLTPTEKKQIDEISLGYEDKVQFFIDKLAQGIAMITAAFYPKDVILRFSDFKTNEYAGLIGGARYEPHEDNPMIGWRGASRYYMSGYKDGFALECKAMLKVRNEYGLTNLKLMIPFCRTVHEGKQVLAEMEKNGLKRGENGLEVYVMCEIPSNVILSDQFAEIFDGFSIGSNDLTQLTLGLDRDSEIVAPIYDERNDAVKRLIRKVIEDCKKYHRKIGICGQAPSDFPDFAQFLVECGIDSISLNPDTVIKTTLAIKEQEDKLGIHPQ